MAHTPGPWHATHWGEDATSNQGWCVDCNMPDVLNVAIVNRGYGSIGEEEANARLIAAAPDLLEALEWYVQNDTPDEAGFYRDGFDTAQAAIKRAKGGE